jgi:endonuclease IV
MSAIRPYRIAAAVKAYDPDAFPIMARLARLSRLDGVQVYVKGPLAAGERSRLEDYASLSTKFVVHAPHHEDGVNPVEPTAPGALAPNEGRLRLEAGMSAAIEAADLLSAARIVIHGGAVVHHDLEAACDAMAMFLDSWSDPRLILENLPAIHRDLVFVGTSAEDLRLLGGGRIRGYCLDLAHLFVASNYFGWNYADALAGFEDLNVVYQHLSNSPAGSVRDRHLPLDAPEGGVPFDQVMAWIRCHPANTTCLEYKKSTGGVYEAQLAVFDTLYRRHGDA